MDLEMKVEPTKERKDYHSELYRLETAAAAIKSCSSLTYETEIDEARVKDGLAQSLLDAITMLRLGLTSHGRKLLRLAMKFQCLKVPQPPEVEDDEDEDTDIYRNDRYKYGNSCYQISNELFIIAKELRDN